MISIFFNSSINQGIRTHYYFEVAGQIIVSDQQLPELAAFTQPNNQRALPEKPSVIMDQVASSRATYNGLGWLGEQDRRFSCWESDAGYQLDIAGIGSFAITANGNAIRARHFDPAATPELINQAILGPALILALAMHDIFCWHASSIVRKDWLAAFAGESGKGKSTLAFYLSEINNEHPDRVTDDVLPVQVSENTVFALPHYPQLKLPSSEQPILKSPQALPIKVIYILSPHQDGSTGIAVQPIEPSEAVLLLIRHTIAARLFGKSLIARHLEFCWQAAQRIAIRRLIYPHDFERLSELAERIDEDAA